ncbi:MAG TPA: hypothetical protein VN939_16080 [Chthoniobacterales bacterium]|nr:hypothetical protein [Chthoniobacterales bacterium]
MEPTSFCAHAVAEKNIAMAIVSAAREVEMCAPMPRWDLAADDLRTIQLRMDTLIQLGADTLSVTG